MQSAVMRCICTCTDYVCPTQRKRESRAMPQALSKYSCEKQLRKFMIRINTQKQTQTQTQTHNANKRLRQTTTYHAHECDPIYGMQTCIAVLKYQKCHARAPTRTGIRKDMLQLSYLYGITQVSRSYLPNIRTHTHNTHTHAHRHISTHIHVHTHTHTRTHTHTHTRTHAHTHTHTHTHTHEDTCLYACHVKTETYNTCAPN
jgi:hypothetical protein